MIDVLCQTLIVYITEKGSTPLLPWHLFTRPRRSDRFSCGLVRVTALPLVQLWNHWEPTIKLWVLFYFNFHSGTTVKTSYKCYNKNLLELFWCCFTSRQCLSSMISWWPDITCDNPSVFQSWVSLMTWNLEQGVVQLLGLLVGQMLSGTHLQNKIYLLILLVICLSLIYSIVYLAWMVLLR